LHEWEKTPKNCNIMEIYTPNQVEQIKNIPNLKIDHLLSLQLVGTSFQSGKKAVKDFDFVDDEPIEIAPQNFPKNDIDFELEHKEEIDIDDI